MFVSRVRILGLNAQQQTIVKVSVQMMLWTTDVSFFFHRHARDGADWRHDVSCCCRSVSFLFSIMQRWAYAYEPKPETCIFGESTTPAEKDRWTWERSVCIYCGCCVYFCLPWCLRKLRNALQSYSCRMLMRYAQGEKDTQKYPHVYFLAFQAT